MSIVLEFPPEDGSPAAVLKKTQTEDYTEVIIFAVREDGSYLCRGSKTLSRLALMGHLFEALTDLRDLGEVK